MIASSELIDNAALFGIEAVRGYLVKPEPKPDWRFIAVFAATSLEQLTKAALAERNVLLLAELSETSVLGLAGVPPPENRSLRTISANKAIERYGQFDRVFDALRPDLVRLLDARNGVVHLVSEQPDDFDRVFDSHLRAIELLLDDLEYDEPAFWGSDLAVVVASRRKNRVKTLETEVQRKIAFAVTLLYSKYEGLSMAERAGAIRAAELAMTVGAYPPDAITQDCPACGSQGRLDVEVDVDWDLSDGEWVPYTTVHATGFTCSVCELDLIGDESNIAFPDVDASGINPYEISDPPIPDDQDLYPYPPPR